MRMLSNWILELSNQLEYSVQFRRALIELEISPFMGGGGG